MASQAWPGSNPSNFNHELCHYTEDVARMVGFQPQQHRESEQIENKCRKKVQVICVQTPIVAPCTTAACATLGNSISVSSVVHSSVVKSYDSMLFKKPSVFERDLQVPTGKRSVLPRGMALVTRMFASSDHAWGPTASLSANLCLKTRTVRQSSLAPPAT
jgi:hypothetical protein